MKTISDFIWDFGKLPFPTHLGKYFMKIGKIRAKIHEIGKIKAIFGLGMTPIYGLKNGQIKSLMVPTAQTASKSDLGLLFLSSPFGSQLVFRILEHLLEFSAFHIQ